MKSENYRQLLNNERDSLEMTAEEYDNTLMHFAELYHKEKQCNISIVSKSLPDFGNCEKTNFLEKYKGVCSEGLLMKIWDFGNRRWSDGYKQGKHSPDFD